MRLKSTLMRATALLTAVAIAGPAVAQQAAPVAAEESAADEAGSDADIVVTARRREERLQSVPVSVTAFTTEALAERQITELRDLTVATPGLVFTSSGSGPNVNITMRAQTKSAVGAGLPSVITYLNDVPLPSYGSSLPTFDIASVQVLKGPQGTYFGRNTTGGAVLVATKAPSHDWNGYASTTIGSYDWFETEGALNIPLIADKVAIRAAFNTIDRDGYTRNLSTPGLDWDDKNEQSYRVSLLIEPVDGVRNLTVFDHQQANSVGLGGIIVSALATGGARSAANAQYFNCSAFTAVTPVCNPAMPTALNDVDIAYQRQLSIGNRAAYSDIAPSSDYTIMGVSNVTTFDMGPVTFKNNFGYRSVRFKAVTNTDATDMVLNASYFDQNEEQFTDEVQLAGSLFNNRLEWLVGGFYLENLPSGINGRALENFRTPATPVGNITYTHSYYRNYSTALFGQLIYDLSNVIDGLKVSGGYRRTWDEQSLCAVSNPYGQARISERRCRTGTTALRTTAAFEASTWTTGIDYQASRNIFLYATARKGYRGGGINSPLLGGTLTPYQTYRPEEIQDFEIGGKLDWNMGTVRGRTNLALYRGKYRNIQGSIGGLPANFDGDNNPATDPASSTLVVNRGAATIQGFELDGFISPISGLTFSYGAAYTDAKFTSFSVPPLFSALPAGVPVFLSTPKWTLTGGVRYEAELPSNAGTLVFNVDAYHSDALLYASILENGYNVVNARIDWNEVLGSKFGLSVFVRNAFNENYTSGALLGSNALSIVTGTQGPPRMGGVQLRYRFGD